MDVASPSPKDGEHPDASPADEPGFGSRGRARRRARFLRKARELAYRDLGGLVFNLHRFGQRNDALVLGKLATLEHIDTELRRIEAVLLERRPVTVLREAGITACPRCAAIHGSEDRYCPNCGLPMSRGLDVPVAGPPAGAPSGAPAPSAPSAVTPAPASAGTSLTTAPAARPDFSAVPFPPTPPAGPYSALAPPRSPALDAGVALAGGEPGASTEIIHPAAPGS